MIGIGDVIRGKYQLVRLLGDGGMGSVYEAVHAMLGTRVAIKVLHADLARKTGLVDRFLQEARVAAQIKSPHVVRVLDVDRADDGIAYIVMELLEGEPLSGMLDRLRKLPVPTACTFARQILDALEAAHALGVVHRDLKPENVFITYAAGNPLLKLIDFGIAKLRTAPGERNLTVAGVTMGTAEYMAPEQAYSASQVDARSDVYAVGVMLFEMIAGRRPVAGDNARTIAGQVERGEVTPLVHLVPDVPREIAGLVHRAMAARPELRFASATEMRIALDAAMSGKRAPTTTLPVHGSTMQGAPIPAAFLTTGTPVPRSAPTPMESSPRTERAGASPVAGMVFASPPGAYAAHPGLVSAPPGVTGVPSPIQHRSGGAPWGFIILAVVVGAAIVGALLFLRDRPASAPPASAVVAPMATLTATPPSSGAAGAPSGRGANQIPSSPMAPLSTSPAVVPSTPSHSSGGHGHNPPSNPTAAPSIPSPFALPTAFPFPLTFDGGSPFPPFQIPTALPSTLPFPIPGLPQASPKETPEDPAAAPSASAPKMF